MPVRKAERPSSFIVQAYLTLIGVLVVESSIFLRLFRNLHLRPFRFFFQAVARTQHSECISAVILQRVECQSNRTPQESHAARWPRSQSRGKHQDYFFALLSSLLLAPGVMECSAVATANSKYRPTATVRRIRQHWRTKNGTAEGEGGERRLSLSQ